MVARSYGPLSTFRRDERNAVDITTERSFLCQFRWYLGSFASHINTREQSCLELEAYERT
jgi:hypothetical protein